MTKNQCMKHIRSMQKDCRNYLIREAQRLLDSGAINYLQYDRNSFELPNIIMTAASHNMVKNYGVYGEIAKKEVENLLKF